MVIMDIGEAAQSEPGSSIEPGLGRANMEFAPDSRRVGH